MRKGDVFRKCAGVVRRDDRPHSFSGRNAHAMFSRAGLMEDLRDELNERYPSFYCDAMVDETTSPLDKQAMRDAGLFEATLLRASDTQRSRADETLAYLQKEFSSRGLALPANIEQGLPDLCERAENLVLELLEGRDL